MTPVGIDRGFVGVNMRLDPRLLPPGYVAEARNCRFNQGIVETRLGCIFPTWAQKFTPGLTYDPDPWSSIQGIGVFNDPNTKLDYLIIAAQGTIYSVHPYNAPVAMTLPDGLILGETVTFTQAGSRLICHRGFAADPLWLQSITGSWDFLPVPDPLTGTQAMPRAERSLYFQGRLWIPKDDDTIAYSDFNDPTSYQAITQEFYINPGSADRIVTLAKVGRSTLVIFKSHSVHVLYGVYGNLASVQGDTLTQAFGCLAPESVVDVGNEIWFLSQDGLRSLVHTELGEFGSVQLKMAKNEAGEAVPVVVGEPMKPVFDRINSHHAGICTGVYWNRRFYLVVPLDAAELLGPEIAPAAWDQLGGADSALPLQAGHAYRYVPASSIVEAVNGTETIVKPSDFTAQGASLAITYIDTFSLSLREIQARGVNNAVLVYDFQNGAWSGYDDYPGLSFRRLITLPVLNRDELLAITSAGWIAQLEQDYEDAAPVPYTDLVVVAPFTKGGQIRVNGGTVVTVDNAGSPPVNTATKWILPLVTHPEQTSLAARNLYLDGVGAGGFCVAGAPGFWTAPGTVVYPLTDGVRFYKV